ncbi:hypothetical protein [Zooshikella ganghwensis]|uniref:hypothetical protein n=1 Tax=Zooshikella ganghwensis TaxID=202772 RepID=UPI0003FE75FD|nr:hypothetical protein [Zooshikella ganghwensis]
MGEFFFEKHKVKVLLFVFFLSPIYTYILYKPAISNFLLLDDEPNLSSLSLLDNPDVSLLDVSLTNESGPLLRPISVLSFIVSYNFSKDDYSYYKFFNLLIHIANSFLLYLVLVKLCNLLDIKKAYVVSVISSVIWMIHPLHLSGIMYVVQRMNLLSTFFMLMALLYYLYYVENKSFGFLKLLIVGVLVLFAVLSKENGLVIIPVVLFLELISVKQRNIEWSCLLRREGFVVLLFFVICGGVGLVIGWDYFTIYSYKYKSFDYVQRLMTQINVVFGYLCNVVFPLERNLGLFFDNYTIVNNFLDDKQVLIKFLIFVLISVLSFKNKVVLFGWFFYLISISMESSVFALEMYFEHRNYFPSIGIIFIMVYSLSNLDNRIGFYILVICYIFFLSLVCATRAYAWSSLDSFTIKEYERNPQSPRAISYMTNYYLRRNNHDMALKTLNSMMYHKRYLAGYIINVVGIDCDYKKNIVKKELIGSLDFSSSQQYMYLLTAIESLTKLQLKKKCNKDIVNYMLNRIDIDGRALDYRGMPLRLAELYLSMNDIKKYMYYLEVAYERQVGFNKIFIGLKYVQSLIINGHTQQAREVMLEIESYSMSKFGIFSGLINEFKKELNNVES